MKFRSREAWINNHSLKISGTNYCTRNIRYKVRQRFSAEFITRSLKLQLIDSSCAETSSLCFVNDSVHGAFNAVYDLIWDCLPQIFCSDKSRGYLQMVSGCWFNSFVGLLARTNKQLILEWSYRTHIPAKISLKPVANFWLLCCQNLRHNINKDTFLWEIKSRFVAAKRKLRE